MNNLIILSNFLLSLAAPLMAQQNVRGAILDHDDRKPVSKASILIQSTTRGTVSRDDGHFSLDGVYPGDTLTVTHLGYRTEYVALASFADTRDITIRLKKEATNLGEVTVYSPFWTKQYTPEEQQEDYRKFFMLMEKMHPGLYTYLSKNKWQALKDSTMRLLQYPLSHSEFFHVIAFHVASVRDKHTRHGVTDWWYRQKQNIFPFNVKYFDDRLFVAESLVPELFFPKGTEILHVNGRSPAQMRSLIWPFIPADGYIQTGRMADLNDYFPWYFALFVEETETYTITLRTLSGEELTIDTPGLRDSFAHLSFQQVLKWKKPSLELQIDDALKTAYFGIDDSRSFKDSLEIYFTRIHDHEVKNLIIDLRGGGGIREEEHTVELFAHLTVEPFRVFDRIEVKSNDASVFDRDFSYKPYARSRKEVSEKYLDLLVDSGKGYYLWEKESYLGIQEPVANPFSGVVYILIDGRNYSASTDFTSLAAQQNNIFTIGEETGGEYHSYASGAIFGLVLPNSKIGIKIPTWKTVLAIEDNDFQQGRGVLPDFYVPLTFQDFMQDRDAAKELAYELIKIKQ